MKRICNYINSTPLNPVLLILFFTIIAYIVLVQTENIEYFFTCIGIGVSIAVVQCSLIQNKIQKDNIKIQLFDKRFTVYKSVLDSVTIIKRDNWDRCLLFNKNDINNQILQVEENLYKSSQLSICLFDKDLYLKLIKVNNAFCKVAQSYKKMLIANIESFKSQNDLLEFITILNSYILSQEGLETKEYDEEIKKKFPKTYNNLMSFSKECNAYLSFIDECGIIKDFGKYIVIDELEK